MLPVVPETMKVKFHIKFIGELLKGLSNFASQWSWVLKVRGKTTLPHRRVTSALRSGYSTSGDLMYQHAVHFLTA